MIVYIDFPQVICYATYSIVVFLLLYNDKGEEKGSFKPAAKAQFSSSSEYLLVTKTPTLKEVELSLIHI